MIPAAAVGAIHRLAWVTDETEAMGLVALAVQRGASPDEAHEAFELWRRVRREDVTTLETPLMTEKTFDAITRTLRANGWIPRYPGFVCGCRPKRLCPGHAERRAVDHYHPETIR